MSLELINMRFNAPDFLRRGMGEVMKSWSLQGMTALVTGGTSGIGLAIVEELAKFGAAVHTCTLDRAQLDQSLHRWSVLGLNVTGSVCDVSVRSSREKLIDEVATIFKGKLNIFVSNAGKVEFKPTTEVTAEDLSSVLATNFEAAYHLSQLSHPLLKASGQGSIVFISSSAGLVAISVGSVYSASKGALNQLAKNLACEWAKDNIRANSIAPWFTKTPFIADIVENKEMVDEIISGIPLRRFAEPKDISPLVAFLCMPVASYITGQVIAVDGGSTINGFNPRKN